MSFDRPIARGAFALLSGSVVVSLAMPAFAQDALGLEEIVVTARKREENLQDVALSITAINAAELERLNVASISDVAALDSSLIFERGYGATDTRITIRGLSPTRGRNNVAVLVDGIDVSSESIAVAGGSLLATSRLVDVERVEIVKGPQSALYGRSAFAGAIQYVTKDPAQDHRRPRSAATSATTAARRFRRRSADRSTTRSACASTARYWNEDGIYRNVTTGNKVGGGDGWGAALTGKWQPADAFSIKARVEYTDDSYAQAAQALIRSNTTEPRLASGTTRLDPVTGLPSATGVRVFAPGKHVSPSRHRAGWRRPGGALQREPIRRWRVPG